jgi:hypothetical protein
MLIDLLTVVVIAFFGSRLLVAFRRSLMSDAKWITLRIVRGLRLRHFLPVPVVLTLVILAAYALSSLPILSFGWWTAVGGEGNPVFGSTERTSGTALSWLVPLVFMILLLPALPLFAKREEEMFRLGAEEWSTVKRVGKAVLFGLVHALIGIPIGVALALSIGGAYFTLSYLYGYRRGGRIEALLESTRAHTAYNLTIVVLVLVSLPTMASGG